MTAFEAKVSNDPDIVMIVQVIHRGTRRTYEGNSDSQQQFAKRFKHWCDGGLVTLQEREAFSKLLSDYGSAEV